MKLFGIFAFAAVAMAELDYDSIGLKKPSSSAVDKVSAQISGLYWPKILAHNLWVLTGNQTSTTNLGTTRMQRSQTFRLYGQVQIVEVYLKKPKQQKPTFDQEMQTQVQKG